MNVEFKNKIIIILSQQGWDDGIFVSKHHYAIELSKLGNLVYFIGGPSTKKKLKSGQIQISETIFPNLYQVEHKLFYPLFIKFKLPQLHDYLISIHIKNILKKINKVDVVWSFDLSNTIPLTAFPENIFKIFMPVDEPLDPVAIKAAASAKIIFSVTEEIIDKYRNLKIPGYCINHGVAEFFINNNPDNYLADNIKVGLSGNFLRPEVDRETLLHIIKSNPQIQFHLFGKINNPVDGSEDSLLFVESLKLLSNVTLHGSLLPKKLAEKLKTVDMFLICYDIQKDQSKGTNYHKILEYLAAGKITVSNNVSSYNNFPGLIEMLESRENNEKLPALFLKVTKNLAEYNSADAQLKRIQFAQNFTYKRQVKKIEQLIKNENLN